MLLLCLYRFRLGLLLRGGGFLLAEFAQFLLGLGFTLLLSLLFQFPDLASEFGLSGGTGFFASIEVMRIERVLIFRRRSRFPRGLAAPAQISHPPPARLRAPL